MSLKDDRSPGNLFSVTDPMSSTEVASFQLIDAFYAFVTIGLLLLFGRFIKQHIPLLQRLYLPESVVAGTVALILGPQVLGWVLRSIELPNSGVTSPFSRIFYYLTDNGVFPETLRAIWHQSPGIFINIVFATLFLGETLPGLKDIWRKAAPQVAFGQSLAWGQYVVGLAVSIGLLGPLWQTNPLAGVLIELAFEGGHGATAGMSPALVQLGFTEGPDLAYILSTVGVVSGVVCGTALVNWGYAQGLVSYPSESSKDSDNPDPATDFMPQIDYGNPLAELLIDPLSLNCGIVAAALAIGWLLLHGLQFLEAITWAKTGFLIFSYVPLFPFAAIGGLIVQGIVNSLHLNLLVSRPLQGHISGVALDVVIVSAFASISLQVVGENGLVLLILSIVGISWNIAAFLFLAPRMLPEYWFERGLGDMGQSMGVTATGILLMQMVDPLNRTGALESFAYKQLLFAPLVGGGIVTAIMPILVTEFGPTIVLWIMLSLLMSWVCFGFWLFNRLRQD